MSTSDALDAYRESFRPSEHLDAPYVMLGVSVICAESEERARWVASPGALAFLRLRQGRPDVYTTPEEAAEYRFTPAERNGVEAWTSSHIVGNPPTVRDELAQLVERTGADELMLSTMVHGPADRLESYRLVAEELALTPDASPEALAT
jgi:alkanesulfonate monooxygenase SsuD/methylene tetrahydromethanopterin reductase-like flavin-dependent oxidoreductase (luciferase family)